jgi:hypothetical protein
LVNKKALLIDAGKTRFTTTNGLQVGHALVTILRHATETANQVVSVESFTTTQMEILDSLERVTGATWDRSGTSSTDFRAEGFKLFGEGDLINGGSKLIGALVFGKDGLEDHTHLGTARWNNVLNLPEETVDRTVRRVLEEVAYVVLLPGVRNADGNFF